MPPGVVPARTGNDHPIAPEHRYFFAGLPQRPFDLDRARFEVLAVNYMEDGTREKPPTFTETGCTDRPPSNVMIALPAFFSRSPLVTSDAWSLAMAIPLS